LLTTHGKQLFLFASASEGDFSSIKRYERGVEVSKFSDIRANVRCLIEGQALQMRLACVCAQEEEYGRGGGRPQYEKIALPHSTLKVDRWYLVGDDPGSLQYADTFCQVLGGQMYATSTGMAHDEHSTAPTDSPSRCEVGGAVFASFTTRMQEESSPLIDLRSFAKSLLDVTEHKATQPTHIVAADRAIQHAHEGIKQVIAGRCSSPSFDHEDKDESEVLTTRKMLPNTSTVRIATIQTTSVSNFSSKSSHSTTLTMPFTSSKKEDDAAKDTCNYLFFERIASGDKDMWDLYGAMLVEYVRLKSMAQL
jgi:hypothetical protein